MSQTVVPDYAFVLVLDRDSATSGPALTTFHVPDGRLRRPVCGRTPPVWAGPPDAWRVKECGELDGDYQLCEACAEAVGDDHVHHRARPQRERGGDRLLDRLSAVLSLNYTHQY